MSVVVSCVAEANKASGAKQWLHLHNWKFPSRQIKGRQVVAATL